MMNIEDLQAEYEEPQGSVWIIGVDYDNQLFVIDFPNLWQCEERGSAEDMGLPPDTIDVGPGVYRVTMDYVEADDHDGEGNIIGVVWEFNPVKWEPLWQLTVEA